MSAQPAQPRNMWVTIGIIAVVLVVVCVVTSCILFVVVPAILGPAIGNVFTGVTSNL